MKEKGWCNGEKSTDTSFKVKDWERPALLQQNKSDRQLCQKAFVWPSITLGAAILKNVHSPILHGFDP